MPKKGKRSASVKASWQKRKNEQSIECPSQIKNVRNCNLHISPDVEMADLDSKSSTDVKYDTDESMTMEDKSKPEPDIHSMIDNIKKEINDIKQHIGADLTPTSKKKEEKEDDIIYHISSDINLDELIGNTLEKLNFGENYMNSFTKLQEQTKKVEKKQKEINRVFEESQEQLDKFKAAIEAEELLLAESESEENVSIGGDSDDEIQFLDAYNAPAKKVTITKQRPSQTLIKQPTAAEAASVINKHQQMYSLLTSSSAKSKSPRPPSPDEGDIIPIAVQPAKAKPRGQMLQKFEPMRVGQKVLAKKGNDIWYKGTLTDVQKGKEPTDEKRYSVKYDGKGKKVVSGRHLAYFEGCTASLPVGSRVVALYRDEDATPSTSFYAGIVAEPPNVRNNHRFLVFFDDGYAQYSPYKDVHKVYEQSRNVWEDIHPDSQDFIKDYLMQYPERPMVRLQKGQVVKTEWNGQWWSAKTLEVDASLVHMFFDADKRSEWIYRGSTRLEPLYTTLAKAEASKAKGRRQNMMPKKANKPIVEYTRGLPDDEKLLQQKLQAAKSAPVKTVPLKFSTQSGQSGASPKRAVAKKSTSKGQRTDTSTKRKDLEASSISSHKASNQDMASVLQERFNDEIEEEHRGTRIEIDASKITGHAVSTRKMYYPHKCSPNCLKGSEDNPAKYKGINPLLIPMLCGWERQISKTMKGSGKAFVFYRAPCARRLRSIEEVDRYLVLTKTQLTIDLFCFDTYVHTHSEFVPVKTFFHIKDLSYGKENIPISCVNAIDRQYPEFVEYSSQRIPAKGVKLNLQPEFLVGCDCTDGCRDPEKCACIQKTVEGMAAIPDVTYDGPPGYHYRRLKERVLSGIYECNKRCKCDHRCNNRVVQHGLNLRLEVFKTEKRGWGLRCLDDIPAGRFVCIYAGQLLTEHLADEDGHQYGDEYLAELDMIEVVERTKEGYESDVVDPDEEESSQEEEEEEEEGEEEYEEEEDDNGSDSDYSGEGMGSTGGAPLQLRERSQRSVKTSKDGTKKTADWVNKLPDQKNRQQSPDIIVLDSSDEDDKSKQKEPEPGTLASLTNNGEDEDSHDADEKNLARSSSRFKNLPNPRAAKATVTPLKIKLSTMEVKDSGRKDFKEDNSKADKKEDKPSTRSYFGEDYCYVMDAKSIGNVGRYMNHSCSPNIFVQNVFVDTHDLRFPWVAYFASVYIRAGTELTWDYNYEVGSVPGKVLYCYCGSAECRGRLL